MWQHHKKEFKKCYKVLSIHLFTLAAFSLLLLWLDYLVPVSYQSLPRNKQPKLLHETEESRIQIITKNEVLSHEPNFSSLHEWSQYHHFLSYHKGIVPQEDGSVNFFLSEEDGHGTKTTIAVVYDGYPYSPPNISSWETNTSQWDRKTRFPSVEERIRYSMGLWYDAEPNHQLFGKDFTIQNLKCRDLFVSKEYKRHSVFCLSKEDPNSTSPKFLYDYAQGRLTDKDFTIGLCAAAYVRDSIDIAILQRKSDTPVLIHFGDGASQLSKRLNFSFPVFGKVRDIEAEKHKVDHIRYHTKSKCSRCGAKHSNIIWPFERQRHYNLAAQVPLVDIPWKEKENKLIWRGRMVMNNTKNDVPIEFNSWKQRKYIVEKFMNSTLIDAKFTSGEDCIPDIYMDDKKEMKELLKFKYQLSLEGNDISSGLKWMLFSNSVVFLTPVSFASWAMETLLEPFVHFVPVHANLSNLEEMVLWAQEHPIKAKHIAQKSTLFVYDLLFHPDAYQDEESILEGIMQRYQEKFGVGKMT